MELNKLNKCIMLIISFFLVWQIIDYVYLQRGKISAEAQMPSQNTTNSADVRSQIATMSDDVRSQIADVRSQIATMSDDVRSQIATMSDDVRSQVATMTAGVRSQIATLSDGVRSQIATMSDDVHSQIATMSDDVRSHSTTDSVDGPDQCDIFTRFNITHSAITQDTPCEARFCPTTEGNKRKIDSYDFAKAEPYMKDLQPNRTAKVILKGSGTSNIEIPVFVSGLSSNHFYEGLLLLENVNNFVRPKYPTTELYMFDLGLKADESRHLKRVCNCTLVPFPFERFPSHITEWPLFGAVWKPLLIKMMLQSYRFMMWMDASCRFKTFDLDPLFIKAKQKGIMATNVNYLIPAYTHEDTFQFLQEPPCLYRNLTQFQSGLLLIYSDNKLTNDYIVTPWVKCALIEECMKTKNLIGPTMLNCQSSVKYHSCHRYDQAVLSLLLYRLFPETHLDHWIDDKYVQFDRLKKKPALT